MSRVRRVLVALAVAALAATGCTGEKHAVIATPPESALPPAPACVAGRAAAGANLLPDLGLPCLGAGSVRLRELAGTPTVVNLWASWCGPCKDELPAFSRLSADAGTRLRVLGVAQERPSAAGAYAAEARLPFPSLVDQSGELGRELGRRGLPVTVLVDADGRVRRVYQGAPLTDATLRALVRAELGVDV